jgi:hypothetical protein
MKPTSGAYRNDRWTKINAAFARKEGLGSSVEFKATSWWVE